MHPNVIYILADDMGYGDMRCNNPDSKIPTPNLDRLAERGMRFDDAHAGSAVCTPSRYNILTGRYAWRSRLKRGIVWHWDGSLIESGRLTVPGFLRDHGYRTACIGKWHLGWDWPTHSGRHPNEQLPFGELASSAVINQISSVEEIKKFVRAEIDKRDNFGAQIDFTGRLRGGPLDHGFDSYVGVDVPNFPPYAWFEDDHLLKAPTEQKPDEMYGMPGPAVPDWSLEAMIPEMTHRAANLIRAHASSRKGPNQQPFFLYLPLTSPHSPIVPNIQFHGTSDAGRYGDFVCEVDWVVGEIVAALEQANAIENTLLIFTSDNGPEAQVADDEGCYERIRTSGHYSMGPLRGAKHDAWEGGHRVPFLASWPEVIPPGSECQQTVCLGDLMATCADIIGTPLLPDDAEDSISMLPLFRGELDEPTRSHIVHHSTAGTFALRAGPWVFIDAHSGGDRPEPGWHRQERGYQPHDHPGELFNLYDDISERCNLYNQHPGLVKEMASLLQQIRSEPSAKYNKHNIAG